MLKFSTYFIFMDKDLKKGQEYSFKMLGIQIALIFAVPLVLVFMASPFFSIKALYLLPISFIVSWVLMFFLYKKTMKQFINNKNLNKKIC